MADSPTPASPESLQLRAAPRTSARLSKKAAFLAVAIGALVLGVIMVNVSKPPPAQRGAASASKDLQPALNMANTLTKDVPDVVPAPLPTRPEPAPAPPPIVHVEKDKPPVRDSAEEARLADSAVPKFVEMQSANMKPTVAGYAASAPDENATSDTRPDMSPASDSAAGAIATGQDSPRPAAA
jgi:type IV secretory pathway VirB10-like protein